MSLTTMDILFKILVFAGVVLAGFGLYNGVVALFGFKKRSAAPQAKPATRFAVVVAARNEQAVIGQLVDSLTAQNYPADRYDIIVAPNNCTDDTAGEARRHGAMLFDVQHPVRSKGEVLHQVVDGLLRAKAHDAVCVFDADNLAHPDFLQRMNDAYCSGIEVAQGFRDSKNPADTAVSTCYSVGYWVMNRFYNGGRMALGLSALVNGSGFMMGCALLKRLGGWNTETMTEDYEFSAQCVLNGTRVHYVPQAVIYDEQPLSFAQSWKQRRRWSTGSIQGMERYFGPLMRTAIRRRDSTCLDMAVTFATPAVQLVSLLIGAATVAVLLLQAFLWVLAPLVTFLLTALTMAALALVACALFAAFIVWLNRGSSAVSRTASGIAFFPLFLLSCLPISIISMFKRQKTWDPIVHTRAMNVEEVRAA